MTTWRPGRFALLLIVLLVLAAGVLLIGYGAQTHEPAAAPLPSQTFDVPVASLPPVPLSAPPAPSAPLQPGKPLAVSEARPGCSVSVRPAHLVIGSLCIDAALQPTPTTAEGALVIPTNVHEIGMWDRGAPLVGPDAQPVTAGTTLLAGHVNDFAQGNGALFDLYQVTPGALVYVSDATGHVTRWRVFAQSVVVKAALPKSVFAGTSGPRQLVLVTCGGPIVHIPGYGNTYRDNVLVTAIPG